MKMMHFSVIINDDNDNYGKSQDSLPSLYQNESSSSGAHSLEPDINPDEQEEKARLISQVLELQNTLDGSCCSHFPQPFRFLIVHLCRSFSTGGQREGRKPQASLRKPSAGPVHRELNVRFVSFPIDECCEQKEVIEQLEISCGFSSLLGPHMFVGISIHAKHSPACTTPPILGAYKYVSWNGESAFHAS